MSGVDYCFSIDCSSHVRIRPRFLVKTILGDQMLIDAASIAIWNKNKVVVTLTIMVWGTGIGFHFYSKFLNLVPIEDLESRMMFGYRYRAGEWPISINLDPLGLSRP
jgi:ABC-type transporter lipoprotein component MlaA